MRPLGLRNIFRYLAVFVVAVSLNFMLPRLMPGNPLALLAGVDVGLMTPAERAEVIEAVGLDAPLIQQFIDYWWSVLRLDLGFSFRSERQISEMIMERLPWTLLITVGSLAVSAVVGIVLGGFSAWRRGKKSDLSLLTGMISLQSLPSFWLGMLLISVFSVQLGWFPSFGAVTPASDFEGWGHIGDIAKHAILPIVTLTVLSIPGVYLTMRYAMLEVLGSDFIRTARAKGASEARVLFGHVARNAIAPVVTFLAIRFAFAFGGSVIIETVFSYPGLGRLIFEAVSGRDYPVMQATFLVFTVAVLVANLVADLLYPILDPRMRVR
ncbi:MAG: ABC transporter permease [Actinomycetota bacterium]|nr:ABC transporter permease [Actinomycetota bacterium]